MDNLFYLLFFLGLGLWYFPSIYWLFATMKTRFHMGRSLGKLTDQEELKQYGKLRGHLKLLIDAAEVHAYFPTVNTFFLVSGILASSLTAFLSFLVPWKRALPWGIFVGLLPYCVLQARLHEKRVNRSREGDVLVQELLSNYRIYDYTMQEALEKTAQSLEGAPLGKRLYLQLAKGLQKAVTKKEVEDLLSSFRYSFDTVWGNILASNIFFAHLYGIKVDAALKDLLFCMTQSRKAVEYGRRENHEARFMLLYLAPISFLLSVFFACRYFDFTIGKFIAYQWGTPLGLQWFLSMAFCYIVSLLIHRFFAKEKMDI